MKGTLECFMQANNNSAALSSFPPLVHYPLSVAIWFVFFPNRQYGFWCEVPTRHGLGTPNSRSEPSSEFQRQETVAPTRGSDETTVSAGS